MELLLHGIFCLTFISGHGVGGGDVVSIKLGGDMEVNFCYLHGDSSDGLFYVVAVHHGRLDYLPLLAIGVEVLLFPFGGMGVHIVGVADDIGTCFFWAILVGSKGVHLRFLPLLRTWKLKLPTLVHSIRCVLFVVQGVGCCGSTMRGLLLFSSERSSSTAPVGGRRRELMVCQFAVSSLGSCYVFFFSSKDFYVKVDVTVLLI
jgi:hypothetical protein